MNLYKNTIKKLLKNNDTVSIAESCTGGNISAKFTSVSGISKIFKMGLITYSNESKSKILNINDKLIHKYGAVSFEIAEKMAINLKKISKSKLCISTTGIAGPKGGTKKKPVGLVFIGIIYKNKVKIIEKQFKGSRKKIQNSTVKTVFQEIKKLI